MNSHNSLNDFQNKCVNLSRLRSEISPRTKTKFSYDIEHMLVEGNKIGNSL